MFYPPVENGLFTFVPCDIHERSYIKKPGKYSVMDGQFENCDNDSSEELHVDPIFWRDVYFDILYQRTSFYSKAVVLQELHKQ